MQYDFDRQVDRRGSDSIKWDIKENELPMWVADMDFMAAPCILKAMEERLSHGVFGYDDVTDEWYEAYIGWWRERHGFEMRREWLMFCTGVVPAISSAVRKLTTPNENVLIQTPVYNIFFNSIINNGRRVLQSPLKYEGGAYSMDLERLDEDMADPQTTLMILCNPHNPVGRIWDRDELKKVGELALKHHVTVLSDEIHCDITAPGRAYVPFASVSDECRRVSITCIAPTKAFNLAGLQSSAICVPDENLRHKVWRAINTDEVAEPNSFAAIAAVAAFTKGGEWLDELREYVFLNRSEAEAFIKKEIPRAQLIKADATYLLWLDVSACALPSREIADRIRQESGLYISAGSGYGDAGEGFLRINIACPRAVCMDGLIRLRDCLENL